MKANCKYCNKELINTREALFCSRACFNKHRRENTKQTTQACHSCGSSFTTYKAGGGRLRIYCSRACSYQGSRGKKRDLPSKKKVLTCVFCQSVYTRYAVAGRPQMFCSRTCYLRSDHHKEIQRKKMLARGLRGEKNPRWTGDKVTYKSLHRWIEIQLGVSKSHICRFCQGRSGSVTMNWANLDGKYTRDLSTWAPLCKKCHSNYDQEHFQTYSKSKKHG